MQREIPKWCTRRTRKREKEKGGKHGDETKKWIVDGSEAISDFQ